MDSDNGVVLELDNICKAYGPKTVLNNISFKINRGDVVGFLGPNGAGKTTTIKILGGLTAPSTGNFYINSVNKKLNENDIGGSLGIMFENPAFYNYLSARRNLEILCRFSGKGKGHIDSILEKVGLLEFSQMKVSKYSQGMRQRLGIARAIFEKQHMLILDEPTNALDPAGRVQIRELIKSLSENENVTILLSSHLLAEVEQICNRVIIINEGRIIAERGTDGFDGDTSLENYFMELTQKG